MNFNYDDHTSPKEESYVNGSIQDFKDFTDCIDFTKQYQKSCFGNNDGETVYQSSPINSDREVLNDKYFSDVEGDKVVKEVNNVASKGNKLENGKFPMEPDVSITIKESNLEKTINHVAKGIEEEEKKVNGGEHQVNIVKKKRVVNKKRNHVKVPVNRNIIKKTVLKFRNGRYMQKRNNQYQNHLTNVKFRCYKCSNSEFPSLTELVNHQRTCLSGPQENPLIPESSPAPQKNVKTPRKLYLCSSCGNYYENWNLFLHMIEMHKRHICLFCLGMFSNPEKLSQHLQTKHNVVEQNLATTEDFLKLYKGTCYLICCSCEKMFSDEKFDEHSCTGGSGEEAGGACPLCGLVGAHFPTCRRGFTDRCVNVGGHKSHPALGKKIATKRKKKPKEVFRIVNNDNEMSVTVRKQQTEEPKSEPDVNADTEMISPLRTSTEQYNEKMLQLYKKPIEKVEKVEKVTSSLQSIEESINRVVESSVVMEEEEEEEEEDTNLGTKEEEEAKVDESKPEEEVKVEERNDIISDINNERAGLSDNESTDSEKLTIALEKDEPENICDKEENQIPTAGSETPYIYVTLQDFQDIKALIKEFVKESGWNCVYCAHAKRIAVNGKQLALHLIAEHRYSTVPSESGEEEKSESAQDIVNQLKENLIHLENCYFNTDTFDSEDKSFWKANDRIYECFHCLFATYVHKELYSHNKKMHQKTVFLCIMCKSNFYNYTELLCHLCPGIYVPGVVINPDITYRCFLCNADPLPSSFRLMVHLRRRHNSCDICFDVSSNQSQLSTHVWKHKLSHYCYRCGIAYRNKPDITKHLFWKHGTESVLCKRCLQKKWPHVYHFCVPPASFICDECSASLKSAVALKVHKRLHAGESPYSCTECEEKFISKKLLEKHLMKHEEEKNPPQMEPEPETEPPPEETQPDKKEPEEPDAEPQEPDESVKPEKEKKKKKKPLTDVFDLPPVNLSESDDSDDEEPKEPIVRPPPLPEIPLQNGYLNDEAEKEEPAQVVDGIWNNFQNYLVSKDPTRSRIGSPFRNMTLDRMKEIMLSDHDYHIIPNNPATATSTAPPDLNSSKSDAEKSAEDKEKIGLDHDYCNNNNNNNSNNNNNNNSKKKNKQRKHREGSKSSSSDSSSDSDSSCSCGSNCSCSSGSSSSSSSNESDSDEKDKRKEKEKKNRVSKEVKVDNEAEPEPQTEVDISVNDIEPPGENVIRDSDLETSETDTDEDFYDFNPAKIANRILAEKRLQLLANLNGSDVPVSSPSTPTPTEKAPVQKKKTKMKKRRSQPRAKRPSAGGPKAPRRKAPSPPAATFNNVISPVYQNQYNGNGTPFMNYGTPIGNYEAPPPVQPYARLQEEDSAQNSPDSDSKRPKRKRVPLKFYGFSSDEEGRAEKGAERAPKKREKIEHNTTTPAPLAASTPTIIPPKESTPTIWNPQSKNSLSWRVEKSDSTPQPKVNPIKIRTSLAMRQNSFYTSAPSETYQIKRPERHFQINGNPGTGQRGEKLYCFCQCPYDEVSEMIACDAKDCVIEWFHFECVGIMVPPQGSWYCPDCRKKLAAENEFMPIPIGEQNSN